MTFPNIYNLFKNGFTPTNEVISFLKGENKSFSKVPFNEFKDFLKDPITISTINDKDRLKKIKIKIIETLKKKEYRYYFTIKNLEPIKYDALNDFLSFYKEIFKRLKEPNPDIEEIKERLLNSVRHYDKNYDIFKSILLYMGEQIFKITENKIVCPFENLPNDYIEEMTNIYSRNFDILEHKEKIKTNVEYINEALDIINDEEEPELRNLFLMALTLYVTRIIAIYYILYELEETVNGFISENIYVPKVLNKINIAKLEPESIIEESQEYISREDMNNFYGGTQPPYSNQSNYPSYQTQNNPNIDPGDKYFSGLNKLKRIYIDTFKIGPAQTINRETISFFNKYYGRIPHLYQRYGSEATIIENRPNGDPVELLSDNCNRYLENLHKSSSMIFNELIGLTKRLGSSSTSRQRIQLVSMYCKSYKFDAGNEAGTIEDAIKKETTYRIAQTILGDHSVYGFTVEGIVQNGKYPPANHIITSIFLENPHESPTEISVNSVFNKPESMLLFGRPEELNRFGAEYKRICMNIITTFNTSEIKNALHSLKESTKRAVSTSKNAIKAEAPIRAENLDGRKNFRFDFLNRNVGFNDVEDPKNAKNISKAIEKGITKSFDIILDQKTRILQCAAIVNSMIPRVADTAKRAVSALEAVEDKYRDTRYVNSGAINVNSYAEQKYKNINDANVNSNNVYNGMRTPQSY